MATRSVRVAVIGGGAVGTSTLFHLAKRHGITDTVLLERDQIASGSTSRAVGGVRYVFSHPLNVEMGLRNLDFYKNFEANVEQELAFRENGYLYVFHSPESQREWEGYYDLYGEYDTEATLLTPDETVEVLPALDPVEIQGSLWAPDCGHIDPYSATQAMSTAARELGATVETNAPVRDVGAEDGRVRTVETDETTYEADYVVNAAGPWAPEVGKMVDVDVPIEWFVRQIMVTSQVQFDSCPLVIDRERQFYFEMEANGSLLVCNTEQDIHDVTDPEGAVGDIGYDYYLQAFDKLEELAPGFSDLEVINDWAGLQSHTADGHAILGPTDVDGFLLACGMSGHGVMQAPSVGAAISDQIAKGGTDVFDLEALTVERFDSDNRIEPERMP